MAVMRVPVDVRWVKEPKPEAAADTVAIERVVREIIEAVRTRGDAAVRKYSQALDRRAPERFRVTRDEIEQAYAKVGQTGIEDIAFARDQVRSFAEAQPKALQPVEYQPHPEITLGHRLVPVESVGCYVPGGQYPLIASAIMQAATAGIAGVARIMMCAPPRAGARSRRLSSSPWTSAQSAQRASLVASVHHRASRAIIAGNDRAR